MARFVAFCSILIAAVLLVGAIATLTYTQSAHLRLVITASFTLLFAGCVSLFTSSGRIEVFTATAAYAAVLVVYSNLVVGQNNAS